MAYVAVAVVGVIGLINVLLLAAVLRRLREHEERLAVGPAAAQPVFTTLSVGDSVGDFVVRTVDGERVASADYLTKPVTVGFFSSGCDGCREQLADFVARALENGRNASLAAVSGDAAGGADLLSALEPVSPVVLEPPDGPVVTAFGVRGSPVFIEVDPSGRVRSVAGRVSELSALKVE